MESASRTVEFWSTSSVAVPFQAGAPAALVEDLVDADTPKHSPLAPQVLVVLELPRDQVASEEDMVGAFAVAAASVEAAAATAEVTEVVGTVVAVTVDTEAGPESATSRTAGVVKHLQRARQQVLAAAVDLAATVAAMALAAAVVVVVVDMEAVAMVATGTATGTAVPAVATGSQWDRGASIATAIATVGMAATTTHPASAATMATATKTPGASAGTERGLMSVPAQPLMTLLVCANKRLPFSSSKFCRLHPRSTPLFQQG